MQFTHKLTISPSFSSKLSTVHTIVSTSEAVFFFFFKKKKTNKRYSSRRVLSTIPVSMITVVNVNHTKTNFYKKKVAEKTLQMLLFQNF